MPIKNIQGFNKLAKYIEKLKNEGKIVKDLNKGLLLEINQTYNQNYIFCKFWDFETEKIVFWIDESYYFSFLTKEPEIRFKNIPGFVASEKIKKIDLLNDEEVEMTKVYIKEFNLLRNIRSPIRIFLEMNNIKIWENQLQASLCYGYDKQLIPGMFYSITNNKIIPLNEENESFSNEIKSFFLNELPELRDYSNRQIGLFSSPIPDISRLAIDIEIEAEKEKHIPDASLAEKKVISVGLVDNKNNKWVLVLERERVPDKFYHSDLPKDTIIKFFKSEKELIEMTFRFLWKYPIILTYNGDKFDLHYLFNRANKLNIDENLNPIEIIKNYDNFFTHSSNLIHGLHFDLFRFFFNKIIMNNVFTGAYETSSLNAVSKALLKKEKVSHKEDIHEMSYENLIWYNLKDALLTMELTQFDNSLVYNLIFLFARMSKLSLKDILRRRISFWLLNTFFFEHRAKNYLIPRSEEIIEKKPGGLLPSKVLKGRYQGAHVVNPIPGRYYNVVVGDFSSLYPSIIKEYNLSYETILCSHKNHQENKLLGVPYHICTKRVGITSYIVGFFRELRINYFKNKLNDKTLDEREKFFFLTISKALKVFMNSFYGIFGSKIFPLFCLPVAESTTGIGQYAIKSTIKKAEELNIKVLYGDTDSLFLLDPDDKNYKILSNWSKEKLNLDLEKEKTYQFLVLTTRKKNYLGVIKETKKTELKGVMVKKRNTPEFIKKTSKKILNLIKEIKNERDYIDARKEIITIIKDTLRNIENLSGFSLEDYSINVIIEKDPDQYKKTTPQHIRAIREYLKKINIKYKDNLEKIKEIEGIYKKNSLIKYIKTKDRMGAKVIEDASLDEINISKYKELFKSALSQIIEPLEIDFNEIEGIKKITDFLLKK